jgi:hypothetical protein
MRLKQLNINSKMSLYEQTTTEAEFMTYNIVEVSGHNLESSQGERGSKIR